MKVEYGQTRRLGPYESETFRIEMEFADLEDSREVARTLEARLNDMFDETFKLRGARTKKRTEELADKLRVG